MFAGRSVWNVIITMALVFWPNMVRLVRSETLPISERPFIKAAKASGASDIRITYFHIAQLGAAHVGESHGFAITALVVGSSTFRGVSRTSQAPVLER